MNRRLSLLASCFVIAATGLSLLRSKRSWIRLSDFPRLQLAALGTAMLAERGHRHASGRNRSRVARLARRVLGRSRSPDALDSVDSIATLLLALATAYQWAKVWRYTPFAPREVIRTRARGANGRLSILEANVLLSNRDASRLKQLIDDVLPDVVLCEETDAWWCEQLTESNRFPFVVSVPLDNTYGMLLMSRLPLADTSVDYLIEPDIPSISTRVQLRCGQWVWLNCVHPRPPAPGKADDSLPRDSELVVIARRVCDSPLPVVVCGDLNDVAWSDTTRLFQKLSGLLDPRKGRGFYSTFHAYMPVLRFPLDHCFHSKEFCLVDLRVMPPIGSDHFPMYVELQYAPSEGAEQEEPEADAEDEREAQRTLDEEAEEHPQR